MLAYGGDGNDTFHTRDGEADNIDCGLGRDRALLDQQDVIVDATVDNPNGSCEVVVRADPSPQDDATEGSQQAPQDNDEHWATVAVPAARRVREGAAGRHHDLKSHQGNEGRAPRGCPPLVVALASAP